jgi:uncharacterized protein
MRGRGVSALVLVALALTAAACGDEPAPGTAAPAGEATTTTTRAVVWPPTSTTGAAPETAPAPTTVATDVTPATAPVPLRTPTAADPLRVLVVGDSVGFDASPGIQAALEATGVIVTDGRASPGVGLTTGLDVADWRTAWAQNVAAVQPELVVVMTGALDVYALRIAAVDATAYRGLADEALDVRSAAGARVVVIGVLPEDVVGATYEENVRDRATRSLVNQVLATAVAARGDGAAYLELDDEFTGPDGRFSYYVPGPDGTLARARKDDGLHMCPDGAALIGEAVVGVAGAWWTLPPIDVSYRSGPWRTEVRYDSPAGSCAVDPAVLAGEVDPPAPWSDSARRAASSSTTAPATTPSTIAPSSH